MTQDQLGELQQEYHLSLIRTSLGKKKRGKKKVNALNCEDISRINSNINIKITTDCIHLSKMNETDSEGYYKPETIIQLIN